MLLLLGLPLLMNASITGNATITTTTNPVLGLLFLMVATILFMSSRKLEDILGKEKEVNMKSLRKEVKDYKGDYESLMYHVVDRLTAIKPKMGFYGTQAKRQEIRELRNLAGSIANKYGMNKKDIYGMISEDLHIEKKRAGRKGR